MNDYLANLAARSLGMAQDVRPRPPFTFGNADLSDGDSPDRVPAGKTDPAPSTLPKQDDTAQAPTLSTASLAPQMTVIEQASGPDMNELEQAEPLAATFAGPGRPSARQPAPEQDAPPPVMASPRGPSERSPQEAVPGTAGEPTPGEQELAPRVLVSREEPAAHSATPSREHRREERAENADAPGLSSVTREAQPVKHAESRAARSAPATRPSTGQSVHSPVTAPRAATPGAEEPVAKGAAGGLSRAPGPVPATPSDRSVRPAVTGVSPVGGTTRPEAAADEHESRPTRLEGETGTHSRVATRPLVSRAASPVASPLTGPGAYTPPSPEVHVSIGTIEVRATPPPEPPQKKERPRPPIVSLGEYLARRGHGGSR